MMTAFRNRHGFSLLEFIIVLAVFSGVFLVISNFAQNSRLLSNLINQSLQVQQDLAQTFQTMVTEIRSMGPSSLGSYPVAAASSTSFIFYSDVDEDGLFERVRYTIGTSTLVRGITKPAGNPLMYATSSESVATVVSNLLPASSSFEYFDKNFTGFEAPLSSPIDITNIRVARITIMADVNPQSAPKPTLFTNTVEIRNLKNL